MLLIEIFTLSHCELLQTASSLVSHWRLVQRRKYPQGIYQGRQLIRTLAELLQVENALAYLYQELVVVVHLLDYLDKVRNQLLLNAVVT